MTANPIELIGGITTTANVPKADIVAWAKARVPQTMANAAEVQTTDLAGQLAVTLKTTGGFYYLDTADTTTAHDGTSVLVSNDNKRFKLLTSIVAPTTISLGGVFSSAAVTNQFLTGIDTAGNVLRAQPAASNLSDGNTGTGAVVHAAGAAQTGGTHDALTSLGIRSTGAAFDLKFATAEVLSATRTLSWTMGGANRAISLAGDVTLAGALTTAGAYALTLTTTGATNVTLPTTGTLATLAGAETLTNKIFNATNNTVSNLTTAMFATSVVDTDGTLVANSDTRLASQKATKLYVDTVAQGLDAKSSVLCATTANIVLSAEQTIDGQLTSMSRILVKNQSITSQNGIYVTAAGAWTRATDADSWAELPGAFVFVEKGTVNGDCGFVCTVDAGGTIDTTSVTFTQFSGAGAYTAGTGLTQTGTVFAIDSTVATLTGAQALTNKTYNGNTWTAGTGVLTLGAGKTATISNTLTFTGIDSSSVAFGAGGTVLYNGGAGGTPSSITLTNGAGLPISTGLTGAGTGVLAALAIAVGSAGAPVLFNGAGGTPSGIVLTNATGLPTAGLVNNAVTLGKMAPVATATFLGRTTASTGDVEALTATQATALLNVMVGDSGAGGTKGLVPAAGAGDAAAGKYLKADGTFAVPPGSGGGGMTDAQRQNALLVGIYQSKSFAGYRRTYLEYYDGFMAADGLNGSSANYSRVSTSPAISYVFPTVSSGTQISQATGTSIGDMTVNGGLAAAFDSTTSQNDSASSTANAANGYVGKNYSGSAKQIGGATIFPSNTSGFAFGANPTVTITLYGKQTLPSNGTDGTVLGSVSFTDSTSSQSITSNDGATAWNYVWVYISTGAAATLCAEAQFFSPISNNMTIITTAQTAGATVTNGRVLIEFDNTAAPTLNTDLTVEITCDAGANWTAASLSAVTSNSQGGRKVAETVDQAATSGTTFATRIKTLNNKNVPIYGVSMTVH